MNDLLDGARFGVEDDFDGGFLVFKNDGGESLVGAELHDLHLAAIELFVAHFDPRVGLAGHIIDDAFHGLFLLLGLFGVEGGSAVDGVEAEVDGGAAEVVGVEEAELLGEAEEDFAIEVVVGHDAGFMEGGLAMLFADEEGGQGLLLVGELLEDDLHGLAVGGHVVGLAGEDVHACFAQLVDLSGGHFGLIRPSAAPRSSARAPVPSRRLARCVWLRPRRIPWGYSRH